MRFSWLLAVAALLLAATSHPIGPSYAILNSTSVDSTNSTYSPLPPSSQDCPYSAPLGSSWPSYRICGLVLFIFSDSLGILRRYWRGIMAVAMSVGDSLRFRPTFAYNKPSIPNNPHPTSSSNATPREAEIARPRPVVYSSHRLPSYHTSRLYLPDPRYNQRQQSPYSQTAGPSYRALSIRRTCPMRGFEEDIEMDTLGSDYQISYDF